MKIAFSIHQIIKIFKPKPYIPPIRLSPRQQVAIREIKRLQTRKS